MAATPVGAFEYDVCLSSAGEDRAYVDEFAGELRKNDVRVFYDPYEQAALWGKNLFTHLDEVYRRSARFCIVFISEYYAKKLWTNHEREAAQTRAFSQSEEYILPVRFDDTEIPGVRPTTGYIDLRTTSSAELCALLLEKLKDGFGSALLIDGDWLISHYAGANRPRRRQRDLRDYLEKLIPEIQRLVDTRLQITLYVSKRFVGSDLGHQRPGGRNCHKRQRHGCGAGAACC